MLFTILHLPKVDTFLCAIFLFFVETIPGLKFRSLHLILYLRYIAMLQKITLNAFLHVPNFTPYDIIFLMLLETHKHLLKGIKFE